ncbi:phage protein [Clostridium tetani]|nr:phage protein [Clostridium tetani]
MLGMIDTIKKASMGAVGASNPVNILFGEVLSIEDFKIKVDQKLILDKDFFIIPESLIRYEVDLKHSHGSNNTALGKLVIREGLKKGDKVLLLRVQGGQQYVILDKVV